MAWTHLATSRKPFDIWYAKQETILEEHSDNRHHCQTAICKFSIQFGLLCRRVRDLAQESRESNLGSLIESGGKLLNIFQLLQASKILVVSTQLLLE